MTTATRLRIVYDVFCGPYIVDTADTREDAEVKRDAHAARNGNDPLSERYKIVPDMRKEQEMLKTPEEWLQEEEFSDLEILDPDGWRGKNGRAWGEPISREEFRNRLAMCTVNMSKWVRKGD